MPISRQKNRWIRRKLGPNQKIPESKEPVVDTIEKNPKVKIEDPLVKTSSPKPKKAVGKENTDTPVVDIAGDSTRTEPVKPKDIETETSDTPVAEPIKTTTELADEYIEELETEISDTIVDEPIEITTKTRSGKSIEKIYRHIYTPKESPFWWLKYLCCVIIIALLLWILYCLYIGCPCRNSVIMSPSNTQVIAPTVGSTIVNKEDEDIKNSIKVVEQNVTKNIVNENVKTGRGDENISKKSLVKNKEVTKDNNLSQKIDGNEITSLSNGTTSSDREKQRADKISVLTETFKPHVLPSNVNPSLISILGGTVNYTGVDGKKYTKKIDSFDVMPTEVTIKEYFYFANDNESDFPAFWNTDKDDIRVNTTSPYKSICFDENCPIVGVSIIEVEAYIKWLNNRTGENYALMNEAQWHHISSYNDLDEEVWYQDNSQGVSHPVSSKGQNDKGIHDSYGNVSELCVSESGYVSLGGSWKDTENRLLVSSKASKSEKRNTMGFRLVKQKK